MLTLIGNTFGQKPLSQRLLNEAMPEPGMMESDILVNIEQLKEEDASTIKQGNPLRIAIGTGSTIDFNDLDLDTKTLSTGQRIWQYNFYSNNASAFVLSFSTFYIPPGDTLYIYSADGKYLERYSHSSNSNGGAYMAKMIYADDIMLEYVAAKNAIEEPALRISNISLGYYSVNDMSCYVNANCSEGDDWELQRKGVVGLIFTMNGGAYVCSGSLVNNVREDETPYILTAYHCIDGRDDATCSTMEVDFFKESTSTDCNDASYTSSLTEAVIGTTLIAANSAAGGSDGALLQLNSAIPEDWDVFYNGWDASGNAADSGVCIHHPASYIKKISTFTEPLESVESFTLNETAGCTDCYWSVAWVETEHGHSVTYGGSSGSPIFNQDQLIVGTLTGGNSYCETPYNKDFYGKFASHWVGSTDTNSFSQFLDPDNTGTLTLRGYYPNGYKFQSTPTALAATDIKTDEFVANWESLNDTVDGYLLSVYTKDAEDNITYVQDYQDKEIGSVLSYTVNKLDYGTTYYYSVKATVEYSISDASNEIVLSTAMPSFQYLEPFATAATYISDDSFQANWESMDDALAYVLNVYEDNEKVYASDTVNFKQSSLAEGWTTSSERFTSTANQFGKAAPALRLNDGDSLLSPQITVDSLMAKSLKLWYRGVTTDIYSDLSVYGLSNGSWELLHQEVPMVAEIGGDSIEIAIDSTLEVKQLKIFFTTDKGYSVIDDVVMGSGNTAKSTLVYDSLSAGSDLYYIVNGLKDDTHYAYTVIGYDGNEYSEPSNRITLKTVANATSIQIASKVNIYYNAYADDNLLYIETSEPVDEQLSLYTLYGQQIQTLHMSGTRVQLDRSSLRAGIYIIRLGNQSIKTILR